MKPRPARGLSRLLRAGTAALFLPLAALVGAQPPANGGSAPVATNPQDQALQAAHTAAADGDLELVNVYATQVHGSMLEPYVEYWQASLRLRGPAPDESLVRPFLTRYAGTVLADRLRADWLIALGAKADFAGFEAERRLLVLGGDDPQLICYTLLARYDQDNKERREHIAREARRQLASISDPGGDGCTALANRLLDEGQLSIWPRLQALVERNQIPVAEQTASRLLPPSDASAIARLLEQPGAWLAGIETHMDRMPRTFCVLAIVALARDAPDLAARYALRLEPELTAEERAVLWGRIGRSAQLSLLPQANEWFERGGDLVGVGLDYVRANEVLEARARAALRRGAGTVPGSASDPPGGHRAEDPKAGPDWVALRKVIARMPAEQQSESTWIYWNAEALAAQGKSEEARAAWHSIADRFSFYGRLAAERLEQPLTLAPKPQEPDPALVDALAQRPGFLRARKLYELGLRDEANREWSWELRGMDDASLHAAAELARRFGALDRMIASSERTRTLVDISQRYPTPYRELMDATSEPLALDPAWIYGLIRQESRFIEDVRSNVGAVGLMQLMPSTARFVARRIGFEDYRADRIADVKVNLRLGTEYLKLVLDDQDGQALLASAAYNAGPRRVRKWRAALARPLDGVLFVETIPVGETRDYVKRVLFNTVVYRNVLERPAVSLRSLLGPVVPKSVPTDDLP